VEVFVEGLVGGEIEGVGGEEGCGGGHGGGWGGGKGREDGIANEREIDYMEAFW
jgi:hypothetical protein